MGNALKFTDRGTVTLLCRAIDIRKDEVDIRIDVEDSGQGIEGIELDRLFEPFTQADGSATRKHGGTGLGLTISRQLVELMGGDIGVESEVGKGTTFNVELTLPLDVSRDPAPRTMEKVAGAAPGNNLRVLAVDDHPINLELLDGLLENEGFEVTSVDGALPALEELENAAIDGRPYSLALLDYQMPEIDGGELAKRIRADRRFDDLRLVILTSIDQALSSAERKRTFHSRQYHQATASLALV